MLIIVGTDSRSTSPGIGLCVICKYLSCTIKHPFFQTGIIIAYPETKFNMQMQVCGKILSKTRSITPLCPFPGKRRCCPHGPKPCFSSDQTLDQLLQIGVSIGMDDTISAFFQDLIHKIVPFRTGRIVVRTVLQLQNKPYRQIFRIAKNKIDMLGFDFGKIFFKGKSGIVRLHLHKVGKPDFRQNMQMMAVRCRLQSFVEGPFRLRQKIMKAIWKKLFLSRLRRLLRFPAGRFRLQKLFLRLLAVKRIAASKSHLFPPPSLDSIFFYIIPNSKNISRKNFIFCKI